MPHLDAAYNLARWITRNDHDAEDAVQDALLRAFRFFDGFRGGNTRSWLLAIVRNTSYTWLEKNRKEQPFSISDEQQEEIQDSASTPDTLLLEQVDQQMVREALEELPVEFREVTILRELEEMSYKEIAQITNIPIGTVMSRLARARQQLQRYLSEKLERRAVP